MTTGINLKQLKNYIQRYYGARCRQYLLGCPDCMAHRFLEDANNFVEWAEDMDKIVIKKKGGGKKI